MCTVLVVDVEHSPSSELAEHLAREGHRVVPARDGREAFAAVTREDIDAIVLCVRPGLADRRAMNGLGGFVWALAVEHEVPLIVTTNRRRDVPRLQEWHVTAVAERPEPTAVDVALRHAMRHRKTRAIRPSSG